MWKFLKKPLVFIPLIIVIVVVLVMSVRGSRGPEYQFGEVLRGDVTQEISITGKVKPVESVDLAFEQIGKISSIGAGVGDKVFIGEVLVRQSSADLFAQLAQAEADVKEKEATLEKLQIGSRPEEIQIQSAKVAESKEDLLNKLRDAYTKSDDSLRNKVDQFISNPQGSSPQLNFPVTSTQLETDIEEGRRTLEAVLNNWNSALNILSVDDNLNFQTDLAKSNLNQLKAYLGRVALAVNTLTASAEFSQATIDGYKTDVATARTNANTALNNVVAAQADLEVQERQLELDVLGSTAEDIRVQEAKVEQARASADNISAKIAKTILRSPINGIVTKQDAKIGEIVSANTTLVSVISESSFEIELNVPEADVAKLEIGDMAVITLDAYGSGQVFVASVAKIDPAETVIDGVSTYTTTLQFAEKDERIRSGMTANVDIVTAEQEGVLHIPTRAVVTKNGKKFVRIAAGGDDFEEIEVVVGIRGSDGQTEILSGLNEGDKIITFIP